MMAKVDTDRAQSAAPASWKRKAAQISSGNPRNMSGVLLVSRKPTQSVAATSSTPSAHRYGRAPFGQRAWRRTSRTGVTTSTPIASPVHQTDHVGQNSSALSAPERARAPLPTVALISIPVSAPRKISPIASCRRSSSVRNPVRRSSAYEQTGARVFPSTMASTAGIDGPSGTLTRNAPSAIPGQTRRPRRSRLATAMPVGGHSGVTWPPTSCWTSPSVPEP